MNLKKSTAHIVLLSFFCVFLLDIVISRAFDSYFKHHIYDGDFEISFIPAIIAAVVSIAVGIALFFRLRGKISGAPLSRLGACISLVLFLLCVSSCVSAIYYPTVLIFQYVISERWWRITIPSLIFNPLVDIFSTLSERFIKFICGGEMPGGILGDFPQYMYRGAYDFLLMCLSFSAAYFIRRMRQTFLRRRDKITAVTAGTLNAG